MATCSYAASWIRPRRRAGRGRRAALRAPAGRPRVTRTARRVTLREALALWRGPALADLTRPRGRGRGRTTRGAACRRGGGTHRSRARARPACRARRRARSARRRAPAARAAPPAARARSLPVQPAEGGARRLARVAEALRRARLGAVPELRQLERRILNQSPALVAPCEAADDALPQRASGVSSPCSLPRSTTTLSCFGRPSIACWPPPRKRGRATRRDRGIRPGRAHRDLRSRGAGEDDALRAVAGRRRAPVPAGIGTGEVVGGAARSVTRAAALARGGGVHARRAHAARSWARHERLDAPLAGRSDELVRLRLALREALVERACQMVTLVGEAGIGKSVSPASSRSGPGRGARRLLRHVRGLRRSCRCWSARGR